MVVPSKDVGLGNSTDWLVSLKGLVEYLNWKNFKLCYPITASKSSRSHFPIKSFSTVHPLVPRSSASSKPMIITMDAIPSTGSCQTLISATIVIGDTTPTTSNIIRARGNGAIRAKEKTVLTSLQPNKLVVVEITPLPENSVVFVIDNSTVRNATIIISNEETIAKHAPSVK